MIKMNQLLSIRMLLIGTLSLMSCSASKGSIPEREVPLETEGDVVAYVTTANRSYEFVKQSVPFDREPDRMSLSTIRLEPQRQFQGMDGFGAAITGSTAYNLLKMNKADREAFLRSTFSPVDGMGYSYVRIAIGCSDFSLSEYTLCDEPGIEHFRLTSEELDYVIPVLREILAIRPELKIMGSPWTPPRWMKVNNLVELKPYESWTSGQLNPKYYQDYATYFVKWIRAMDEQGIPIYSITLQNEPMNRANSASMFMSWQEQQRFIREALAPAFRKAAIKSKVYVYDHNYDYDAWKEGLQDQVQFPVKLYADREVNDFVAGAAYHNYGGNREELNKIHALAPDKELIFTETSIGEWNEGHNFAKRLIEDMEEVALGTVNNWCRGVMVWNLMLDSKKGPFRPEGCNTCYGAVDIDQNDYKTMQHNSHYFIIGHLAAVVEPGAVRIGTSGYADDQLIRSAFKNADGSLALVLLNKSDQPKTLNIYDGTNSFGYNVPAKSVVSLKWNTKQ